MIISLQHLAWQNIYFDELHNVREATKYPPEEINFQEMDSTQLGSALGFGDAPKD
jgi:hypothetical protein